ncbi:hypothetical protein MJO29_012440, partial [Puccinia striiformis f. sp. tritici]
EDDSNLYPQLSSAAISTYQELDAFNASPDDSKPTSENENLTADEHCLAMEEGHVHSTLPARFAFHLVQVSVNLCHRLSSGVPIRLLANQLTYALSLV